MPLHRVTFSGRFAQFENELKEPVVMVILKGLFAMAIDIAIALIVAVFAFSMFTGKLISPYERGFYCYEVQQLSKPFRPNTVSSFHLLTVSLASPFFIISIVEAIIFIKSDGKNKLRKYFHSATSVYLEYVASFTLATFLMEVLKCAFARLRPHYLTVCKPNWDILNCSNPENYIESAKCMGTDMHRIRIGRQSFPSGHTAAAVLFFTFVYFYLKGVIDATRNKSLQLFRTVLLIIIGSWMVMVMATRITDHWHHPTDVLGGIILGISCAYIPLRTAHSSMVYKKRSLENPHYS